MFRNLLFFGLCLLSSSVLGQNQSPGQYCRMGKHSFPPANASVASAQDSVHVQHYDIRIDSLNFTQQSLWGVTTLTVESKVNGLNKVRLVLDGFEVDSVLSADGMVLQHTYDDLNLQITIPNELNIGETDTLIVIYHGSPAQDPSGWGGFYWLGSNYAFNLGVGFEEDPHVFGRAWFPCIDAFTDRASYSFHIKVEENYQAFCNGELELIEPHANGANTYHWEMDETIPTYLASMAVGYYHFLEREYSGIPAMWAALSTDTMDVLNTFQHMQEAVDAFVSSYGPYRWDKIGYALVPFNSGAMEHASSIHIGKPFVNGTLNYETLWAHELAHMWWGDLVTCENQENMWLNEGFAAYSEALFTEAVYGEEAYKEWIRTNHRKVLQFAHITDGEYYAMNDIPHNVTYGSTVYEKGPEVAHTLRNHMGDELFFQACRDYMDTLAFGNANSHDLRDVFSISSGMNLNPFFDGWVFEAGFPHFAIDSFIVMPIPDVFQVEIFTRQKQRGNNHVYEMPVEVNLANEDSSMNVYLTITEETQSFTVHPNFEPTMITIDRWEKMSDAIADCEKVITTDGIHSFPNTNVEVEVLNAGNYPNIIRVEDHFVQPDGFIGSNPGIVLNPYHYWTVDGIFSFDLLAAAEFRYNGSTSTSSGYMDNDLILDEDSLLIMYRPGPGHEWEEVNGYELVTGALTTNKIGSVRIDTLNRGEYVLARHDFTAAIEETQASKVVIFAFPNPSNGLVRLQLPNGTWHLQLQNITGKTLMNRKVVSNEEINLEQLAAGTYLINARKGNSSLSQKLIIK